MARLKSEEKRAAILEATAQEIAESGLGAPTARIARRAGVAEGTLFTYFASKEAIFNALYIELKQEVYRRINAGFPHQASLERRAWHIWSTSLDWAIECPARRRASVQLSVSDLLSPEARGAFAPQRGAIEATLRELEEREALRGLPPGFAAGIIASLQEATADCIARHPRRRRQLTERAFGILWRGLR